MSSGMIAKPATGPRAGNETCQMAPAGVRKTAGRGPGAGLVPAQEAPMHLRVANWIRGAVVASAIAGLVVGAPLAAEQEKEEELGPIERLQKGMVGIRSHLQNSESPQKLHAGRY